MVELVQFVEILRKLKKNIKKEIKSF